MEFNKHDKATSSIRNLFPKYGKALSWRFWEHTWQRLTRGHSDEEVWSLDTTFIEWFLPRLKNYYRQANDFIEISPKDRKAILDSIKSMEEFVDFQDSDILDFKKENELYYNMQDSLSRLFSRLGSLWW